MVHIVRESVTLENHVHRCEKYLELCWKMLPKYKFIFKYLTKSENIELENLISSEIRLCLTSSIKNRDYDERILNLKQIKLLLLKVAVRQNKRLLAKKRSKNED